jgi:hypothetical protein
MIEVKASNGRLSVVSTVSDFCDAMGYCEFKIPLALRGIKPPPTEATIEGAKAHQKQEQFEKEHFEIQLKKFRQLGVKRVGHGTAGSEDTRINSELIKSNSKRRLSVNIQYVPKLKSGGV